MILTRIHTLRNKEILTLIIIMETKNVVAEFKLSNIPNEAREKFLDEAKIILSTAV